MDLPLIGKGKHIDGEGFRDGEWEQIRSSLWFWVPGGDYH